jgi:hypothetical protein
MHHELIVATGGENEDEQKMVCHCPNSRNLTMSPRPLGLDARYDEGNTSFYDWGTHRGRLALQMCFWVAAGW